METVKILYDDAHLELTNSMKMKAEELESKVKISLNFAYSMSELIHEVVSDPNYNLVIVHLGGEKNGRNCIYNQIDRIKNNTNAILVAESSMCPLGEDEVLEHFDDLQI